MTIKFTYLVQTPSLFTFEMPKLKAWVESYCQGKVLNLFAGKTKLNIDETRVDSNSEMPADYHMDAEEFCKMAITKCWRFDTIIIDPPYNLRKSIEKYKGKYMSSFQKIKVLLPEILNKNGVVITLGYTSSSLGEDRGFDKVAVCLICHNGAYHDTIAVVEKRINDTILESQKKSCRVLEEMFNVTT